VDPLSDYLVDHFKWWGKWIY